MTHRNASMPSSPPPPPPSAAAASSASSPSQNESPAIDSPPPQSSESEGFTKYSKLPPSDSSQDIVPYHEDEPEPITNGHSKTQEVSPHAQNGSRVQRSSGKDPRSSENKPPATDGGYGWFILLAAHCTLIFREGIAKCLGVFLPTFRTYFDVSTSLIGWISSLCVTFADFTGLISGPLCRRFGCRPIAMAGGFFGGTGLILAAGTTEVSQLSLCLSLSGIGLGLALTPSLTMVGHYFEKRYSLANGLSYAGSGVGILVLAPLAQILIDTYGWRGGLFIMGALCFHVSVCGALLRPIKVTRSDRRRKDKMEYKSVEVESDDCVDEKEYVSKGIMCDLGPEEDDEDEDDDRPIPMNNGFKENQYHSNESFELKHIKQIETENKYEESEACLGNGEERSVTDVEKCANIESDDDDDNEPSETRAERCYSLLGLSLFKDVYFIILMIVQFCGRFVYMGWLIYLVPHAQEKGIAPLQATFIASVAGVSNIVARAGHGLIVDYKLLTAAQLLTIASFMSALPMLLDPALNTYGVLIAASLTYGAASGVFFPIAVVVIKQSIGMERFPNALGWSYGFAGIGRMSAGFLTGWLFDHFGSYDQSFILLGIIQTFASALLIILLCLNKRKMKKEKEENKP
ncbi:monocarboxylate transporter 3-like isoform X1 [Lytechinus variegatus]|uniref:monocarboxylate transporter 3-like isoform X1 n=1 Tax=Lytechinus variegatus TaxID=7654 RepID=UPI001BB29F09|nr:monocarboxylate transporter 3-like isoform X1 [Lytechinus variegatus]